MNPEGWLRCYTGTPEGGFIPADDLCPEFPPALYLGAAVADVQGDELPDVLVVIDFGTNRVLFGDAQGGLIDATEALVTQVNDGSQHVLVLGFESADHPVDDRMARALEIVRDFGGNVADDEVSAGIIEGMPRQWPQRSAVPIDDLWD